MTTCVLLIIYLSKIVNDTGSISLQYQPHAAFEVHPLKPQTWLAIDQDTQFHSTAWARFYRWNHRGTLGAERKDSRVFWVFVSKDTWALPLCQKHRTPKTWVPLPYLLRGDFRMLWWSWHFSFQIMLQATFCKIKARHQWRCQGNRFLLTSHRCF